MALKAGYYGIKKNLVNKLTKLTGIYSIGSGLNLSSAGALSVKNATTSQKGIVQLDDVPTDESNNVPTSNGVYDALQEKVSWDEQAVLGAKNLLPNNAVSTGIFTVNSDKTITANGTPQSDVYIRPYIFEAGSLPSGDYILSGCPNGGSASTYEIQLYDTTSGTVTAHNYGGDTPVTVDDTHRYGVLVYVRTGTVVSNLLFKPMLRLASDPDDTYAPYAMTNRELTERKLDDVVSTLTSSHNLNDIKKVGFYRIGDSTPTNSPISNLTYCCLEVLYSGINQGLIQRITGSDGNMWFRTHAMGSDVWNSWYKVTTTIVS